MRIIKAAFLVTLVYFAAIGFGETLKSYAAAVLARINTEIITVESFDKQYKDNLKFFQYRRPSKQEVLNDLISRKLAVQEARKLGLDKNKFVIDRIETVLYHALLEKELNRDFEKIFIKDKEARNFYKRNPEIRTSHIFFQVSGDASKKDVKDAYEKIKRVRRDYVKPGKLSFAEISQRYSEGVAAPMGGDIDYQTRDKLDPAYYAAAIKLKIGKVSDIVRTRFGFHIVKLTGRRTWKDVDRPKIKRLAFEYERQKIYKGYMKKLRSKAKISINKKYLKN